MQIVLLPTLLLMTWCLQGSTVPHSFVFKDMDSKELNTAIQMLESPFSMVSTAKEAYGMAEVHDEDVKCSPYIIRVTDRTTLLTDVQRPQVIISGEIHGDERVVRLSLHVFSVGRCGITTCHVLVTY